MLLFLPASALNRRPALRPGAWTADGTDASTKNLTRLESVMEFVGTDFARSAFVSPPSQEWLTRERRRFQRP